jgi:hypothetical protein
LQDSVNTPSGRKAASVASEVLSVFGRVVLFFVKFVMAVIGFSLLFAAIGVFVAMIAVLFDPSASVVWGDADLIALLDGMSMVAPTLFVELVLLCATLPLLVIGMALLSFTFGWKLGRTFYGVTLGLWGAAMIFCGIVTAGNARFIHDKLPERIERYDDGHWESHERHHGRLRELPPAGDGWERRSLDEFDRDRDSLRRGDVLDGGDSSGTRDDGRVTRDSL